MTLVTFELQLYGFHVHHSPFCHSRLTCHQRVTTSRSPQSTCTWWLYTVSETVSCDSYNCPSGYTLIDDAGDVECNKGKCRKSLCCDRVCSTTGALSTKDRREALTRSNATPMGAPPTNAVTTTVSPPYRQIAYRSIEIPLPVSSYVKQNSLPVDST